MDTYKGELQEAFLGAGITHYSNLHGKVRHFSV